jgi:hypothetical protein
VWQALDAYRDGLVSATVAQISGDGDAGYFLRQAGLESVIAERMRVRSVISAHRALRAGAGVGEVAAAMGCTPQGFALAWSSWAGGQVRLRAELAGLGLSRREYEQVAAVVAHGCRGETQSGAEGVSGEKWQPWDRADEAGGHVGSPGS